MDLSYITKLANIKRTCSEAEQLRDKINKENKKSIQWRVEHQASYHQLSEKFKQLESNYECLQQNMLRAQMEREKMSEAYLNEKQHRHQLLNKVTSTREICEALTKYTTGLQETLSRCRSDLGALCDAYNNATDIVKNMKMQYKQITDKMQTNIANLEEKVNMLNENRSQLEQFCESSKQEASSRIANSEQQCVEERRRVHELRTLLQEESLRGNTQKMMIQQMEKEAAVVQKELQDLRERMNKMVTEMESDLQKQVRANELLKNDINNYKESMAILHEENNKIQDFLAAAEINVQRYTDENQQLNESIIQYEQTFENLRKESATLEEKCQDLLIAKETELNAKVETINELTNTIAIIKIDNDCKEAEIVKMQEECKEHKNYQLEIEANLSISKEELLKLKEEIEANNKKNNEMLSEWKKAEGEGFKLKEVIETQEAVIKENKAKLEELQEMYNSEIQKSSDIIKEKEDLTAVNKNLILEHNNERDDLNNRIAEFEKLIEEKKMERQVTSMKSVADIPAASQDNVAIMNTHILPNDAPIRNDMFFVIPPTKDVYNYNFSDSSQGSHQRTDFSGIFSKNNQMKTHSKRKKAPHMDMPARDTDGNKAPRTKIFKTKNVYQRKAN